MSTIKSFSVGDGDMYYIKHDSDNFTIIDCCLPEENKETIFNEIKLHSKEKGILRFISTHPDEDHIKNLDYLDDQLKILNFYCVKNNAIKQNETRSFKRYCELRDSTNAYYIYKGCERQWMNKDGPDENGIHRGNSGINILWPDITNQNFITELHKANLGLSFNNISTIINYKLENGIEVTWMGDLENNFMEKIKEEIYLPKTNILFAPHHGRTSGRIPNEWLETMDPDIIIMGEGNSNNSDYTSYANYNKIRQNSAKDIEFTCEANKVHIYTSNINYSADFNLNYYENYSNRFYIGTLHV